MSKVIKNFLYNSLYQILIVVIPLIMMPYLSRMLGKTAIGIYSYTNSVVLLFATIGLLGLNTYSEREVAYSNVKGKEELSKTFKSLFYIRIFLMVCVVTLYVILMNTSRYKIYFLLQLCMLVYYFCDISWLFVGIEAMKIVVLCNSIVKIAGAIMTVCLVNDSEDLGLCIIINGMSMLFGALIMFPYKKKYIKKVYINGTDIKKHIMPTIKLFLPQAASSVYVLLDKSMIKWLNGDIVQVGFYDQSQMIVKAPLLLAASLTKVMMPRVSHEYIKNGLEKVKLYIEKAIHSMIVLAFPLLMGLIGIAPGFIPWYLGKDFLPCICIVQVLAICIFPISLTYITGIAYLTACNKEKELIVSYALASIMNIILNISLIPMLGVYGAAIGTICAEIIVFLVQYPYMIKELGSMHLVKKSMKSIISAVIMCCVVLAVGKDMESSVLTTLVQVGIGMISYSVIMIILKDKMIMECLEFAKKYVKNNWSKMVK